MAVDHQLGAIDASSGRQVGYWRRIYARLGVGGTIAVLLVALSAVALAAYLFRATVSGGGTAGTLAVTMEDDPTAGVVTAKEETPGGTASTDPFTCTGSLADGALDVTIDGALPGETCVFSGYWIQASSANRGVVTLTGVSFDSVDVTVFGSLAELQLGYQTALTPLAIAVTVDNASFSTLTGTTLNLGSRVQSATFLTITPAASSGGTYTLGTGGVDFSG